MLLLSTNLEKMVDLVLYDFLTTGINTSGSKFQAGGDGVYSFVTNQQKLQALFYNKQLFLPTQWYRHQRKPMNIVPDTTWIPVKLGLVLSRIKPKSIYTKDSLLIIAMCLYHTDFSIVFDLDLVNSI